MPEFHLPQAVVNGYTSMMRNMFLTSSIGLAAMTFSKNFKKHIAQVRFIAYCIFIYSIIYGIKAAHDFNEYLKFIENSEVLRKEDKIQFKNWQEYDKLTYLYCIILIIFVLIMIVQDISYYSR